MDFERQQKHVKQLEEQEWLDELGKLKAVDRRYENDRVRIHALVFEETRDISDFYLWVKYKLSYWRWALTIPGFRDPRWIRYDYLHKLHRMRKKECK